MTVKNIARAAAELLTAADVVATLNGDPDVAAADDEVKIFVKAVNTAAVNAAYDGFPIVKTETVRASGGKIAFDAFTRTPSSVGLVEAGGRCVSFGFDSRGISVPDDGEYTVTFTVEPESAELLSHVETGAGCDFSVLAFLTARNYCLMTGRTDEAQVWDQMYDSALMRKRLSRRASLPVRVWR